MLQTRNIGRTWQNVFRLGLYDYMMPINFDRSIASTFALLDPDPNHHILDVCTGSGRLLVHAAPWLRRGGKLVGFDLLDGGLEHARCRATSLGVAERVRFVQGDVLEMGRAFDTQFDGAIVHFAIYTFGRQFERCLAWRQIARCLSLGASLALTVPSADYTARGLVAEARQMERQRADRSAVGKWFRNNVVYRAAEQGTKLGVEDAMRAGRFHGYSEAGLRFELTDAGFDVVSLERIGGMDCFRVKAMHARQADKPETAS